MRYYTNPFRKDAEMEVEVRRSEIFYAGPTFYNGGTVRYHYYQQVHYSGGTVRVIHFHVKPRSEGSTRKGSSPRALLQPLDLSLEDQDLLRPRSGALREHEASPS